MSKQDLIIKKLIGYSGIRLLNGKPLQIKPGINLIVGRNGSGKSNFIRLIQSLSTDKPDVSHRIESSFFLHHSNNSISKKRGKDTGKKFGKIPIMEYSYKGKVVSKMSQLISS